MAAPSFTSFPRPPFPQGSVWPDSVRDSVQQDQAAIEQARQELGPEAEPKAVLARAKQIAQQLKDQAVRRD